MKRWALPLTLGLAAALGIVLLPWKQWWRELRATRGVTAPRILCAESTNITVGVAFRFPIQVEPVEAQLAVGGLKPGWVLETNPTSISGVVTNAGDCVLYLVATRGAGSSTRTVVLHATVSEGPKTDVGGPVVSTNWTGGGGGQEFQFLPVPAPAPAPGPGPNPGPPPPGPGPTFSRAVDVRVSVAVESGTSLAGQGPILSTIGTTLRNQVLTGVLQDGRLTAATATDTNAYELHVVFTRLDVSFRHHLGNEAFGDGVLYMIHGAYACHWQWKRRGDAFVQPAQPEKLQGDCAPTMFQLRPTKTKKGDKNEPIRETNRLDWAHRQGVFASPQFWGTLPEQITSRAKSVSLP